MSRPGSKAKNRRVSIVVLAILAGMGGLAAYAPELYQLFCAATGYGGTVQQAQKPLDAGGVEETVTVTFDANVAPGLAWSFRPEQRRVTTRIGEPKKVYYVAKNESDETVVARATFNVTPYKTAPYFFKIECFCFTEEKLGPGESARMPLVFYVDKQILKDENTDDVRDITLSYTFFRQKDLSAEEVAETRDLKEGSRKIDARLEKENNTSFANDARRR